jgi:hypothetical protein
MEMGNLVATLFLVLGPIYLIYMLVRLVRWLGRKQPPVPPPLPDIANGPGRYKVTGVDRETKMDCVQYYEAMGPDNARVKAELDGIVVTRIERAR